MFSFCKLTAALMIFSRSHIFIEIISILLLLLVAILDYLSCLQIASYCYAMSRRCYHFFLLLLDIPHIYTAAFCWFNKNSAIFFFLSTTKCCCLKFLALDFFFDSALSVAINFMTNGRVKSLSIKHNKSFKTIRTNWGWSYYSD